MRNRIDWHTLAPQIIEEVARDLIPNKPIIDDNDREIRFGNQGSLSVNKRDGTFYDHEDSVGGGLLDMITHLSEGQLQPVKWLEENGYLNNSFQRGDRHKRPQPNLNRTTNQPDMFKQGLKLWNESKQVTDQPDHPVRRWCADRSLVHPDDKLPEIIRWHSKQRLIVVSLAPLDDYLGAYPNPPEPRQFQLIAIDSNGKKRSHFKGKGDKRTWGSPGVTCIALFGDPNAKDFEIAEGIADALSRYSHSHVNASAISTIGALNRLINDKSLLSHLSVSGRSIRLCTDNDPAGQKAQDDLARKLSQQGSKVYIREASPNSDPAEEAKNAGWKHLSR